MSSNMVTAEKILIHGKYWIFSSSKERFRTFPQNGDIQKKGLKGGILLGKNTYTLAMPYVRKRPATLLPGIFLQGVINITVNT